MRVPRIQIWTKYHDVTCARWHFLVDNRHRRSLMKSIVQIIHKSPFAIKRPSAVECLPLINLRSRVKGHDLYRKTDIDGDKVITMLVCSLNTATTPIESQWCVLNGVCCLLTFPE
jgi:hypothetical protein